MQTKIRNVLAKGSKMAIMGTSDLKQLTKVTIYLLDVSCNQESKNVDIKNYSMVKEKSAILCVVLKDISVYM